MNFEERVKDIKKRCKASQNGSAVTLSAEEVDTLILAYRAGDMSVFDILYSYMEHCINTVIFQNGDSNFSGALRDEFMARCREVFQECLDNFECFSDENFEEYILTTIKTESAKFKSTSSHGGEEGKAIFKSNFNPEQSAEYSGVDVASIRSLVSDNENEWIENAILLPEVLKLLDKLGADHKQVIIDHVLKGMTYAEIGAKEGKHKSTIKSRYYKAIRELKILMHEGHKDVALNEDNVNHRMIKSYRTWKAELDKRRDKLDFDTEFLPYLSEEYRYIFMHVLMNYSGEQNNSISAKLNKNSGYVACAIPQIFNKMDIIIQKKQEIKDFYERYGGEEGKQDLESFLSDDLKIVLNEYMLSINPNAAGYIQEKYPDRFPQAMYKYVSQITNTFDKIMERKKNCESFIRRYGGKDFLLNVFGPMLASGHYSVLVDTLMDYHYSTLVEYSLSIGKSSNYANATQEKILDKLLALKNENAIPEVSNSKQSQ